MAESLQIELTMTGNKALVDNSPTQKVGALNVPFRQLQCLN